MSGPASSSGSIPTGARPRSEGALQTLVVNYLRRHGWIENRSPGPTDPEGIPDLTGCLFGRAIAIELKHPLEHGPTTSDHRWPKQKYYLDHLARAGGIALGTNSFNAVYELVVQMTACKTTSDGVSLFPPIFREVWV